MATPILLPASDSEDALVDAIAAATAGDAPLHLGPGVHFTKPGRRNLIPIGAHGLSIAAQPSAPEPVTIRRPDNSILAEPDDNFGLFFVPERPTPDEEAQLTWRPGSDAEGQIEFDVIIRGRIRSTACGSTATWATRASLRRRRRTWRSTRPCSASAGGRAP